ncbi:host cell division inhibitor Icd-like protein [Klebsiella pneumoniae]|uniref:host cell division inhibitor Icd-like protein n=1 Tax=Klebsiella pneumoniae TaxID=573 RepID=UPI0010331E6C|nr:host cell division inhibitor Icd-like protein [Klebsiella pneumoniae]MCQ4075732.1 host cell division inhibitor Icd-like protein [Klebsiella pneumoniae]HCC6936072.1 host cell division inhibitor Icd-like protein [Klebsiella pneumoniae]HDW2212406.1 host cell division inhibitor Icd-like protein [Klebsiella pneumoniae]
MIAVQRKPLSLAGLSVDISCNSSVMDNKFPSFSYVVKRDTTVAGFATSTLATSTRTREGEFLESIKKGLPTIANPVYGYSAPAKSGAGIGVLQLSTAHNRAKCGFFVCVARLHPSMVGWARASKDAPVSVEAGTPTSFSSPPAIGVFGGDYIHHSTEAAAMLATTPTQNPQFIWLIAAVRRDMPTITAKIHHIAAETEQEARRSLARDHVCFFAGRIRTGGAHA